MYVAHGPKPMIYIVQYDAFVCSRVESHVHYRPDTKMYNSGNKNKIWHDEAK